MNTLNFDEKGCLKPYTIIETDLTTFRETFGSNQHRLALFDNYESFNDDLQNLISCPSQWIGGSFVTLKERPKDIDTVRFIPFHIYHVKERQIEKLRKLSKYMTKKAFTFFVMYLDKMYNLIFKMVDNQLVAT